MFDVKYKSFDFKYGAAREDLFQLHTYIGQYGNTMDIKACGFIYPVSFRNWTKNISKSEEPVIKSSMKVLGTEIEFYILFLVVPDDQCDNYQVEFLKYNEAFLSAINKITQ